MTAVDIAAPAATRNATKPVATTQRLQPKVPSGGSQVHRCKLVRPQ